MKVAGHSNETRIRSLVIGESEFICCCCCENMVFSGQEIRLVALYKGVLSLCCLVKTLSSIPG